MAASVVQEFSSDYIAYANRDIFTPLSLRSKVSKDHCINVLAVVYSIQPVPPEAQARYKHKKADFFLTSPDIWPSKEVLSIFRDTDKFMPKPGAAVALWGVSVNMDWNYEESTHSMEKTGEKNPPTGTLDIYHDHKANWWTYEVGELEGGKGILAWWKGVQNELQERAKREPRKRAKEKLSYDGQEAGVDRQKNALGGGGGGYEGRLMSMGERAGSHQKREGVGSQQGVEIGRLRRENVWGKGWWKIDGLY